MPDKSPKGFYESLCGILGEDFPAISKARSESASMVERLERITRNGKNDDAAVAPLIPADTSIVMFGSLARREWTLGSDVDWTLLVDGQADPHHRLAAREFENRLRQEKLKEPGPAGVFGNVSFSHELIHCIGGEQDTKGALKNNMNKLFL